MNRPNKNNYKEQVVGYSQHLDKYIDYLEQENKKLTKLFKWISNKKHLGLEISSKLKQFKLTNK